MTFSDWTDEDIRQQLVCYGWLPPRTPIEKIEVRQLEEEWLRRHPELRIAGPEYGPPRRPLGALDMEKVWALPTPVLIEIRNQLCGVDMYAGYVGVLNMEISRRARKEAKDVA